jgi:hypothetical protein
MPGERADAWAALSREGVAGTTLMLRLASRLAWSETALALIVTMPGLRGAWKMTSLATIERMMDPESDSQLKTGRAGEGWL